MDLTIDRARPRLVVSPARVQPGGSATVSGSGCYGSDAASVPVVVRWPGGSRTLTAVRNVDRFTVRFTVPAGAGTGAASVTLDAGADCPGSVLPQSATFQVFRPAASPAPSPSATASSPPSPTDGPSSAAPSGSSAATLSPSPGALPPDDESGQGSGLALGLAGLAAAGLAAAVGVRLLRRAPQTTEE